MSTEFYQNNIAILKGCCPALADAVEAHDIDHLNFEVIERRVATLSVNGIQLSSAYDPVEEALAYRCMTSGDTYHLWGFGIGSVPEVLLNDKNLKKLHIYIYNLDVFKLVITLIPKFWLADKRVQLHYVYKDMPNQVNILSNLFSSDTMIINADFYLAQQHSKSDLNWLIHRIENRLITVSVNRTHTSPQYLAKLRDIDRENYPILKKIHTIDELIKSNQFEDVLCIGAGPSLDAHIKDVKSLIDRPKRPLLIAPSTALNALLKNNIHPDIVMIIDIGVKDDWIPFEQLSKATILVGGSRIQKNIFEKWQGKKYFCHLVDETFDEINNKLPTKYRLNIFGSVIHPITNLAILFGAKTIRFIGCDFGFPGGIERASTQNYGNIQMTTTIENGYGELIKSSPTYRMFCSGIESMISVCKGIDFINMSRLGAKIVGTRYEDEAK